MTPPTEHVERRHADTTGASAVLSCAKLQTLKKRADFLRAAKARRVPCPAFLLQARERCDGQQTGPRVGFTCSKKIGNAVERNRAKRRLREVARKVMARQGRPDWDYVLVGRPRATTSHDFAAMCTDLERALAKVHRSGA